MPQVLLSLGTNIGDRFENLKSCVERLSNLYSINKVSSIFETEPWGVTNQDRFLNMCLEIETTAEPEQLLATFKKIEKEMGRQNIARWGPRLIDIDLLYYNSLILNNEKLKIPHSGIYDRAFVLVPLNEIAPKYIDPVHECSIQTLMNRISLEGVRKYHDQIEDTFHDQE